MIDNNDEIIARFMKSNRHEIEDNGFSERVIRNLPSRIDWLSRVLDMICIMACTILFVIFDGFTLIYNILGELFSAQSHILSQNVNYTSLIIAFVVCLFIGLERVCSLKW